MKLQDIGFYTLSDDRANNVSYTSQMMRCEMIINEACNFKCDYCRGLHGRVFGDRKRKELSLSEMQETIDIWCKDKPLKNIRFSGGEPTYHRHIIDIVKYAADKGIERIAVSTNGSNKTELYEDLIINGCNDFSISLDASDSTVGDKMAGNIPGAWRQVVSNIVALSRRSYTTVGVVLTPDNIKGFIDTVIFADSLGVDDIRVIPAAQWNHPLPRLSEISDDILSRHPILRYRVYNFIAGRKVRGITCNQVRKCPLVMDDSVVAGKDHYPCVIYMREQGEPIGKVGPNMRSDRISWYLGHDTYKDEICKKNCLDVCVDYNTKAQESIDAHRAR